MILKRVVNISKDYLQRLKLKVTGFFGCFLLAQRGLPKSVIIMVDGGFASVLLKYVMGLWFEKKWGWQVKYDLGWFEKCSMDMDGVYSRKFQFKTVFPGVQFEEASPEEITVYKRWFRYKNRVLFKYSGEDFLTPRPLYLDGYYANWRYLSFVREDFMQKLNFGVLELDSLNRLKVDTIRKKKVSVALHIRRGDFVNLGLCFITIDYYLAAIEYIRERVQDHELSMFIFSNGFDWVKTELLPRLKDDYDLVDINDNDSGYYDLYLMSQCHHQIISNSWLGFFAAYLNTHIDGMIVVPDRISNKDSVSEDAYGMPGWIRLSGETGQYVGIHGE